MKTIKDYEEYNDILKNFKSLEVSKKGYTSEQLALASLDARKMIRKLRTEMGDDI